MKPVHVHEIVVEDGEFPYRKRAVKLSRFSAVFLVGTSHRMLGARRLCLWSQIPRGEWRAGGQILAPT